MLEHRQILHFTIAQKVQIAFWESFEKVYGQVLFNEGTLKKKVKLFNIFM